jgi:hypothetical protein
MRNVQGANNFYLGDKSQHFWGESGFDSSYAMPNHFKLNYIKTLFESLRDENRPHPENLAQPKLLGPTKADWVKLGRPWP